MLPSNKTVNVIISSQKYSYCTFTLRLVSPLLCICVCSPFSYLYCGLPLIFLQASHIQFVFRRMTAIGDWLPARSDIIICLPQWTWIPLQWNHSSITMYMYLSFSEFQHWIFVNQKETVKKVCHLEFVLHEWPLEARGSLWRLTQHIVILKHYKWMFLNKWYSYIDFSVFKLHKQLCGMTLEGVNQRRYWGILGRILVRLL